MFRALIVCLVACSSNEPAAAVSANPCEADCDRQVRAACPKTPAGYADACKQICGAVKGQVASNCQSQLAAQYQCSLTRVTWTCNASGSLQATPAGACAAEANACATCNGKVCGLSLGG